MESAKPSYPTKGTIMNTTTATKQTPFAATLPEGRLRDELTTMALGPVIVATGWGLAWVTLTTVYAAARNGHQLTKDEQDHVHEALDGALELADPTPYKQAARNAGRIIKERYWL